MSSGNEIIITDANFQNEVLNSKGVILVDFWAEWCGPCQMMGPVIEQLAEEFKGKARIGKLNVDENPQSAASYGITAIPTLLIFKDGQAVDKIVGFQPKESIANRLKAQLG